MSKEKNNFEKNSKKYHKFFRGKISTELKVPVETLDDFSTWYTPGVAGPCREIAEDQKRVFDYTNRSNSIAVISDGSRVLGLGDIGPKAGLPVMEGKSLLFKYLGGVDAYPICVDAESEDEIVEIVERLSPSFGGINLEDLESPKCFPILERLRDSLDIPVWHDDQQGTALVSTAGLLGALKVVGKDIEKIKLTIIGSGAAGVNIAKYSLKAGAESENLTMVDSRGILSTSRDDIDENNYKHKWAEETNPEKKEGGIAEALNDSDACIAASAPGPGIIEKDQVKKMAGDAILFATANPTPEILPEDAKEAGARIVGTGRSDYSNQINNSLGFPAVFRGALEVAATSITDEMCIAAAYAIADRAEEIGLTEESVIPTMEDFEMYVKEAVAVSKKAMEQKVARKPLPENELEKIIREKLRKPREINRLLVQEGYIARPQK